MKKAQVVRFFAGLFLLANILMLFSVMKYGRLAGFVVSEQGEVYASEVLVGLIAISNIVFVASYVVYQRRKIRRGPLVADWGRRDLIDIENISE